MPALPGPILLPLLPLLPLLLLLLLFAVVAQAQLSAPLSVRSANPDASPNTVPEPLRGVRIDQKLDQQLPLDLVFRDESGRQRRLGEFFDGRRPVLLSLVYYECPMLCTMVLNGLLRSIRALSLDAGREYEILTVSFDPREGPELARAKKASYVEKYSRPTGMAGWHFLTGDEANIRKLTGAAGFRYTYDAASKQFAHASAVMVVTPAGRLARYFYGIEYSARDLRLGLVEASNGKIGSAADQVLLYCFHYDPITGRYGMAIMGTVRAAGAATVLLLGGFVVLMLRRERYAQAGLAARRN